MAGTSDTVHVGLLIVSQYTAWGQGGAGRGGGGQGCVILP